MSPVCVGAPLCHPGGPQTSSNETSVRRPDRQHTIHVPSGLGFRNVCKEAADRARGSGGSPGGETLTSRFFPKQLCLLGCCGDEAISGRRRPKPRHLQNAEVVLRGSPETSSQISFLNCPGLGFRLKSTRFLGFLTFGSSIHSDKLS